MELLDSRSIWERIGPDLSDLLDNPEADQDIPGLPGLPEIDWDNDESFFDALSPNDKPTSFPTPAEVHKEARQRSKSIFEDWGFLNQLIQRHEATIQKRWLNKTRQQRQKILLNAWPRMAAQHRPDFEAFTREKSHGHTKFREPYLWPNINQEDLLKPKLFPIFLNARARHPPSFFAGADWDSTSLGNRSGNLGLAFLNMYTMMFTGRNTPETYGELFSWEEHQPSMNWATNGRGAIPGCGLQILEVQERVYSFLLACCRDLLHDMSEEDLLGAPAQPEPPRLSTAEPGIDSLAAVASEAPYRVPAHLDLGRLKKLIEGRRTVAEDHIWTLREDPSYFADVVLEMKEHRQEMLPDKLGQKHPLIRPRPSRRFWERIFGFMMTDTYFPLVIWDDLLSQTTHLQSLTEKYAGKIDPDKDLPAELFDAYLKLWYSLERYFEGPIGSLRTNVPSSPPLRSYYAREPDGGDLNKIFVSYNGKACKDPKVHRLLWIFETLWNPQMLVSAGLKTLMDELERTIQEPSIRALVTPRVAGMIADLSILAECRHQISLYQPWASTFSSEMASRDHELKADYEQKTKVMHEIRSEWNPVVVVAAGDMSDGRFYYPVDKRKTRENTEAIQAAERNLDEFWTKVDAQLSRKTSLHTHPALRNLLSEQRILRRTPDWIESDTRRPGNQRMDDIQEICRPLSQIYFELEHRTQSTLPAEKVPVGKKAKTKTRGVPQPTESPAETIVPDLNAGHGPDVQPTFAVDKRAYKVFSTLFYKPSKTAQPGEIPWNDFLHAMGMTGFGIEKLYGSVWQFSPTKLDVERAIQFHEPHPIPKIPFRMMRRFGRRLARAYGWHGDMFKLGE